MNAWAKGSTHVRWRGWCVAVALLAVLLPVTPARAADGAPPTLSAVAPLDHGNVDVTLGSQPIVAEVADSDSGIDPATVQVSIEDLSAGQAPMDVPREVRGNIIQSAPLDLRVGHKYRTVLRASDRAGNPAKPLVLSFNPINVEVPSVPVSIPEVDGTAGELTLSGRKFTFRDVEMRLSKYSAEVDGKLAHEGFGYFGHNVDLAQARIRFYRTLPDGTSQELPGSPMAPPPSWGSRNVYTQAVVVARNDPTVHVSGVPTQMPELSATVPAAADRAVLQMSGHTEPFEPLCANPSIGCAASSWPTPDPFPFYLSEDEAATLNVGWQNVIEQSRAQAAAGGMSLCLDGSTNTNCAFPELDAYLSGLIYELQLVPDPNDATALGLVWEAITPISPYNQVIWSQLRYLNGYPVYSPTNFAQDCERIACDASTAAAGTNHYCADWRGRIQGDEERCYQFIYLHVSHRFYCYVAQYGWWELGDRHPCNRHEIVGAMLATYGFYDYNYDDMLLAYLPSDGTEAGYLSGTTLTEREYYKSVFDHYDPAGQAVCRNVLDDHVEGNESQPGQWGSGTGAWYGKKFGNLKQWTKSYVACHTGGYVKNRLFWAYMTMSAYFDAFKNREAELQMAYGHRKHSISGSWGCGVGFGSGGGGVSCGYSLTVTEKDAWARSVHTNFSY